MLVIWARHSCQTKACPQLSPWFPTLWQINFALAAIGGRISSLLSVSLCLKNAKFLDDKPCHTFFLSSVLPWYISFLSQCIINILMDAVFTASSVTSVMKARRQPNSPNMTAASTRFLWISLALFGAKFWNEFSISSTASSISSRRNQHIFTVRSSEGVTTGEQTMGMGGAIEWDGWWLRGWNWICFRGPWSTKFWHLTLSFFQIWTFDIGSFEKLWPLTLFLKWP